MSERETQLRELAQKVRHISHNLATGLDTARWHDYRLRILREIEEELDHMADTEQRPESSDEPPFAPELASSLIVPRSVTDA